MTKEQINKLTKYLVLHKYDYVWWNRLDEKYETDDDYLEYLLEKFFKEENNDTP